MNNLKALPHGPNWEIYEIEIKEKNGAVRVQYLLGRNIVELVCSLIGDWTLRDDLRYAPVQVWTSKECKSRAYGESWTRRWWWRMQMAIRDRFATIIPVFVANDKTKLLVMCGGQEAHPVYVTIGNIPKAIRQKVGRHTTLLLGYLPVDDFPEVSDVEERARLRHQLTHNAMAILMKPLKEASKTGVIMTCADGLKRRTYPMLAAVELDWPEQCGMACTDEGGCPVCEQVYSRRSEYPNLARSQKSDKTIAALRTYRETKNLKALDPLRLKPWWPWWASMPNFNFHSSIMPDLLHQLYQGMVKSHVVRWAKKVIGVETVDRCFKGMPGMVGLRHFTKGIHAVKQWTGRESKEPAKQLLPVVAGQKEVRRGFISIVRSVLDFTFRAHKSQMTDKDIDQLERGLAEFHSKKKVLVTENIYPSLDRLNDIRKLHMLTHWTHPIREMGTPDGFNTESPEHLHIVYAKRGWRASNKVQPLPQMIQFVQNYEAIRIHRMYMDLYYGCQSRERKDSLVVYGKDKDAVEDRRQTDRSVEDEIEDQETEVESEDENSWTQPQAEVESSQHTILNPEWSMAINPTAPHVTGDTIVKTYGARDFDLQINEWLAQSTSSGLLPPVQTVSLQHKFNVWHKFYLHHPRLHFDPDQPPCRDTIRAKPPAPNREGSMRSIGPGSFDTVLFLARPREFGIHH
ncbi:hypothetical protein FRC07_010554, partial [Ceratobasidium sp. 392]